MADKRRTREPEQPRVRGPIEIALLSLLTGCAILDPIQLPDAGNSRILVAPPLAAASQPDAAARARAETCADWSCFAGGLGLAIADMDTRRQQLNLLAANVVNGTATYNALLWPVGAAVLYQRMINPAYSLMLPAAVAAGAFGFLSSGVSDRDKHYVLTARRLSCEIVDASVDLYKTSDLKATVPTSSSEKSEVAPPLGTSRQPGLYPALSALQGQVAAYAGWPDDRLLALALDRPKGPPPVSDLFINGLKRQHDAAPKAGATPPTDSRREIINAARRQQELARATQKAGEGLRNQIDESGMRLRARWSSIESSAQEQLASRVPPPQDPRVVFVSLKDVTSGVTAQSKVGDREADFDPTWLDGLDKGSREKVLQFLKDTRVLQQAVANVQGWLDDAESRRKSVGNTLASMNCKPADLTLVVNPPLQSPTASGATGGRPTTQLTPGSTPLPSGR